MKPLRYQRVTGLPPGKGKAGQRAERAGVSPVPRPCPTPRPGGRWPPRSAVPRRAPRPSRRRRRRRAGSLRRRVTGVPLPPRVRPRDPQRVPLLYLFISPCQLLDPGCPLPARLKADE